MAASFSSSDPMALLGRSLFFFDNKGRPTHKKRAFVVDYDTSSQFHIVEDEETCVERVVDLKQVSFQWADKGNDGNGNDENGNQNLPSVDLDSKEQTRFVRAARLDAVDRRVQVFSKKCNRYFEGTILSYNENTRRHNIGFVRENKKGHVIREISLKKRLWNYTDLFGPRPVYGNMTVATSKYAGVQRISETLWRAFQGNAGGVCIGLFRTEKDAALAHDFYAQKAIAGCVNFPRESWNSEAQVRKQKCTTTSFHWSKQEKTKQEGTVAVVGEKQKRKSPAIIYYPGLGGRNGHKKYRYSHAQDENENVDDDRKPPAKKPKLNSLKFPIGTRFVKKFDQGLFNGTITGFDGVHYQACYSDGDEDEMSESSLNEWVEKGLVKQDRSREEEEEESSPLVVKSAKKSFKQETSMSRYKGVSKDTSGGWRCQVTETTILETLGHDYSTEPLCLGIFDSDMHAALEFDRVCRRHGMQESDLNFPRNTPLQEPCLFDAECFGCFKPNPADAVATPCNHIFCRDCITKTLKVNPPKRCPSCQTAGLSRKTIRSITLQPFGALSTMAVKEQQQRTSQKYPDGTRFVKKFPNHGLYHGTVIGFEGARYQALYSDGDEDEMSQESLDRWIHKGLQKGGAKVPHKKRLTQSKSSST